MSADGRLIIREEDEDDAATARTEEEEGTKGGTVVHSRDTVLAWAGLHTLLFIHSLPVHSLTRSAPTCWGSVGNSRDKELGAKATSSNFEFLKLFRPH